MTLKRWTVVSISSKRRLLMSTCGAAWSTTSLTLYLPSGLVSPSVPRPFLNHLHIGLCSVITVARL